MHFAERPSRARPDLASSEGSFTASGTGGQRLTVIPGIRTIVVNLMNTDEPGPRIGSTEWDNLIDKVMSARHER